MAKKLTKIDQQRIDFLNNIDFSDWKINNQVNIHDWYKWDYRQVFTRYHDVMFDYYKRKSDEEFVKKWWFAMVHKNIQKDVNFHEYPVTNQKADFTIDSAQLTQMKLNMHYKKICPQNNWLNLL